VVENVYELLVEGIHDMDEANRQEVQDDRYTRSLEELVKARTEQLQQAVSQNEQFLGLLKQIQSMESLEQVREATHAAIRKFAPQETRAPKFGGDAGESVPEVDPDDLKAIWQIGEELRAKHPGAKAVGVEVIKQACKPGANVEATWYRSSMIWMLSHVAQQQLAPWLREGQVSDPVFRTIASIPMQWVGSEVRQGLPFDIEEFLRCLNEQ
jgi:hypothetical protein